MCLSGLRRIRSLYVLSTGLRFEPGQVLFRAVIWIASVFRNIDTTWAHSPQPLPVAWGLWVCLSMDFFV